MIETILTVIGTIASILGAIISIIEAIRSKKFANEAKKYRDSIIQKRETVELSNLHSETKRILDIISKIGPSSNTQSIRGIQLTEIRKQLEKYILLLTEQRSHFNGTTENIAMSSASKLKPLLESLSDTNDLSKIKQIGKEIFSIISAFLPVAKDLTDYKKEL